MNPKVKAFLWGALEAAGVGLVLGISSEWAQPGDIVFTKVGMLGALSTGAKVAIIYLCAYLRQNSAFRPVWTEEERAKKLMTDDERRIAAGLPSKRTVV